MTSRAHLLRAFLVTSVATVLIALSVSAAARTTTPSPPSRSLLKGQVGSVGARGTLATCGPRNCRPTAGPGKRVRCPLNSVKLRPGRRLQAAINARPEGTTFCLWRGTYHLKRPLIPKSRDVFIGQYGAVLKGSKRVGNWTKRGAHWVATGQTQENDVVGGVPCRGPIECNRPESVFIGNRVLLQVSTLSAVRPGRFFFDYPNNTIYIADDPRGRRVEASVAEGAFWATDRYARGVVIKNFFIERFANPSRTGVIYDTNSPGWVITKNAVTHNHGVGIVHQDRAKILNNNINHNGQLGLSGYRSVGALVRNNVIAWNAIGGFAGFETGGAKYVGTTDLTIQGNYVHDNRDHGLWTDTDNIGTAYSRNTIVANKGFGIIHEAAYGCVIRSNYIADNGAGGIFISSSSNVDVFGNSVVGNRGWGIDLFIDGASGYDLANDYVHGNTFKMRENSRNGITTMNVGDPASYSTSKNNRFRSNSYFVFHPKHRYWHWAGAPKTWRQWRSAGQDTQGAIHRL